MGKFLKILVPGMLVAATGVGAGDLITAALAGNNTGLVLLWAPLLGALLKWALNEGLARWQLATGKTIFEGWVTYLGPWIQWVFLVYLLIWSFMVGGALINACGSAGAGVLSFGLEFAQAKILWGVIHSILALLMVWRGGFAFFEKLMAFCVGVMFPSVIISSILVGPSWGEVFNGIFVPSLSVENLNWTLALLGGVGGSLTILAYGYWIKELGREGKQGLKESRIDLGAAYLLTGLFSVSMIILGNQLNLDGVSKAQLSIALANELAVSLGPVGKLLFTLGFWAGVFSSMLGVWQGVPYLFTDFMVTRQKLKIETFEDSVYYKSFLVSIAILPMVSLGMNFQAVQLVYAVMGACFMPLLALTLLIMNNKTEWVGKDFQSGWFVNLLLVLTLIFFSYSGLLKIKGLFS